MHYHSLTQPHRPPICCDPCLAAIAELPKLLSVLNIQPLDFHLLTSDRFLSDHDLAHHLSKDFYHSQGQALLAVHPTEAPSLPCPPFTATW